MKIIFLEYNGDYWHCNPTKYTANQTLAFPQGKLVVVKDIWERDKNKIKLARDRGYKVIVIWESVHKKLTLLDIRAIILKGER